MHHQLYIYKTMLVRLRALRLLVSTAVVKPRLPLASHHYGRPRRRSIFITNLQIASTHLFTINMHKRCMATRTDHELSPETVDIALANLRLAADNGDPRALHDLGALYEEGEVSSIPVDKARALEYYQKGAAKLHPLSMYKVACYLEEGVYIEKDMVRAVELVRYAAQDGYYDAQKKLAYYYEHGIGVPVNLEAAAALHRRTSSFDAMYGDESNVTTRDLGVVGDLLEGPVVREPVEGVEMEEAGIDGAEDNDDDEIVVDIDAFEQACAAVEGQKMPWAGQAFYMPPEAQYTTLGRNMLEDFVLEGGGTLVEDAAMADMVLWGAGDAVQATAARESARTMREGELIDVAREAVRSWINRLVKGKH